MEAPYFSYIKGERVTEWTAILRNFQLTAYHVFSPNFYQFHNSVGKGCYYFEKESLGLACGNVRAKTIANDNSPHG
jgi:hypothetical protein